MQHNLIQNRLKISEEVQQALANNTPIVSLESTVITHGMPYPDNLTTIIELQNIVRNNSCVPATICIMNGFIHVGLTEEELGYLAKNSDKAIKCSSRDISLALFKQNIGSTTVAATAYISELAGIKFFATGGIGGVHRGFNKTMDVSNDLIELNHTSVAVFCAGVKSILNISKTLEVLETQGVQIVGVGTTEMPAFYTRKSNIKLRWSIDTAEEAADILKIQTDDLKMNRSIIFAIPIPKEFEADGLEIEEAIKESLAELKKLEVKGSEVTPFLLRKVCEKTGGKSLKANIELIKNNTNFASLAALAYFKKYFNFKK